MKRSCRWLAPAGVSMLNTASYEKGPLHTVRIDIQVVVAHPISDLKETADDLQCEEELRRDHDPIFCGQPRDDLPPGIAS